MNRLVLTMTDGVNHLVLGAEAKRNKSFGSHSETLGGISAIEKTAMQLTMRTKITCGFVIVAVAMMVTDVCRLVRTPAEPAFSAASAHHGRRS